MHTVRVRRAGHAAAAVGRARQCVVRGRVVVEVVHHVRARVRDLLGDARPERRMG